jgi:hypothetical protein
MHRGAGRSIFRERQCRALRPPPRARRWRYLPEELTNYAALEAAGEAKERND